MRRRQFSVNALEWLRSNSTYRGLQSLLFREQKRNIRCDGRPERKSPPRISPGGLGSRFAAACLEKCKVFPSLSSAYFRICKSLLAYKFSKSDCTRARREALPGPRIGAGCTGPDLMSRRVSIRGGSPATPLPPPAATLRLRQGQHRRLHDLAQLRQLGADGDVFLPATAHARQHPVDAEGIVLEAPTSGLQIGRASCRARVCQYV